jgi:predicted TPR repeat methyltransferase
LEKVRDLQTPDEREAEDLKVGKFYQDKGDWNAAYLRYKDAVKYQADDPDAHFSLAEVAVKLNKRDEAIAEYKATLTLDASDKQIKAAKKALAELK